MKPTQNRKPAKIQTVTSITLALLPIFTICAYLHYLRIIPGMDPSSLYSETTGNEANITKPLLLLLLLMFSSLYVATLLRRRRPTWVARAIAIALGLLTVACTIYYHQHVTSGLCYGPPSLIPESVFPHACTLLNDAGAFHAFLSSPLVTTVVDIALVIGIGSLSLRLTKPRVK